MSSEPGHAAGPAGGSGAPRRPARDQPPSPGSLRAPGIWLGVGLGGFVDGIVLHQVLQWHHLLSSSETATIDIGVFPTDTVRGLEVNTLWDGLFHAFTWVAVVVGLVLLQSRMRRGQGRGLRAAALWGWVLFGWGAFNLVEGVVNHHLLQIHHVRAGPDQLWYDLGFLAFGVLLMTAGWLLQRTAGRRRT